MDPQFCDSENSGDWAFQEFQLDQNTRVPVLPECASTISLVAERTPGAAIKDGPVKRTVNPGDISLSIGANFQRFRFLGQIRLYLLVVARARMLRLGGEDLGGLPCVFNPPIHVRDQEIKQSMHHLRENVLGHSRPGRIYGEAYANSIVLRALRRSGWAPLHSPDYKDPLSSTTLRAVLDHMYGHAADPTLRSDTLAQVAGLPVDVFRHRFRKSLRKSVHQCLIEIRLEIAADRLAHTSQPVGQIAINTGFADPSHFSRVFRDRMGRTPSEFRELARAKGTTDSPFA